jgi:hypothetical protein
MGQSLSADQIAQFLAGLIAEAEGVEPKLALRLKTLSSWIHKKSAGQIRSKPYVFALLLEVCLLAENWLILKAATPEDMAEYRRSTSLSEQYWEIELFSRWFNEPDPKQKAWQQHLMAGDFTADDARTIQTICMHIRSERGNWVTPLLADLAMATDIIAATGRSQPLCVQLTSQRADDLNRKQVAWEKTLRYWQIPRGLLLSFAPLQTLLPDVAATICRRADALPAGNYKMELF